MSTSNPLFTIRFIVTLAFISQSVECFSGLGLPRHLRRPSASTQQLPWVRYEASPLNTADCVDTLSYPVQIRSKEDWKNLMENEEDGLTLIWFTAKFCKTCHVLGREWKTKVVPLATNANREASTKKLRLASADFVDNRENQLFQLLNIRSLPAVQFYYKGRIVSSFTCAPQDFSRVVDTLECYFQSNSIEEFQSSIPR